MCESKRKHDKSSRNSLRIIKLKIQMKRISEKILQKMRMS